MSDIERLRRIAPLLLALFGLAGQKRFELIAEFARILEQSLEFRLNYTLIVEAAKPGHF